MQTIKITCDNNTEVIIDNEGITINGDNIRINEVVEENKEEMTVQELLATWEKCVNKCTRCSGGFDAEKLIKELRDNTEFQNVIKDIICDNLLKK